MSKENGSIVIPTDKKLVVALYDINMTSVVYSSLLGLVRDYIKSIFPVKFFNSEFVQNSIYTIANSGKYDESMVKDRPTLTMAMKYDFEEASFGGDPFLSKMMLERGAWLKPYLYTRLAWDRNKGIYITSSSSKAKNVFEFILTLNSEMQALNTLGYLRSHLGENKPVYLNNRYIEVPIPPSLIAAIAAAKGISIRLPAHMDAFNDMLHEISGGRITFKLHNSSGKFAYFYKYKTNLLFRVTSFDTVDKEVVDKSIIGSAVRFNVSVEYDTHTNFILESYQNLTPPTMDDYTMLVSDTGTGSTIHATIQTPISSQLPNGQYAVFTTAIITDIDADLDETEFEDYINKDVIKYINHLKKLDPTLELLNSKVTFKLYRDGVDLEYGKNFIVDWKKIKLKILIPYSNYDHRFVMYTSITEVNDFIDSLNKSSNI